MTRMTDNYNQIMLKITNDKKLQITNNFQQLTYFFETECLVNKTVDISLQIDIIVLYCSIVTQYKELLCLIFTRDSDDS